MNAPTWLVAVEPRCHRVCIYGTEPEGIADAPRCWHPAAMRHGMSVTVSAAREAGASCGPEASLMEFRRHDYPSAPPPAFR